MDTSPIPKAIEQAGPQQLRIDWHDGHTSLYAVRDLRLACRCANCVDEHSGLPRLEPASVPADVVPVNLKSVGRYAIQFDWSDGHDTGIYTFDQLRRLCPCCSPEAEGER